MKKQSLFLRRLWRHLSRRGNYRNLSERGRHRRHGRRRFPDTCKTESEKSGQRLQYVIVNCAECEPYLTSDYRRMIEEPEKLIAGLKVMLKLFQNAKGTLAVEDNKPDAIALLKEADKG